MPALPTTDLPFHEAFADLKAARGVSLRALHRATKEFDPAGSGISTGHLGRLAQGADLPSPAAIALIARALQVQPGYFAEFRLAEARALLDERRPGGLDAALEHWRRLEPYLAPVPEVTRQRRRTPRSA
jgi:transcriptional regulator with XRE-family HTH domain